jgi:hypothetical protein
MNQSFVALEIVAHRVWFKYNLGGVTAAIRNSHMIVVGQWYQVWAQRYTIASIDGCQPVDLGVVCVGLPAFLSSIY